MKRSREETLDLYVQSYNKLLVYIDHWVEDGRVYPVVCRLYNEQRNTLDVCIYDLPFHIQQRVQTYYQHKRYKPYWVDFIGEEETCLSIALSIYHEEVEVCWIKHDTVLYCFENNRVVLFTTGNDVPLLEKHFNFTVTDVVHVREEVAKKPDFLLTAIDSILPIDAVILNAQHRAISSIRARIIRLTQAFPFIKDCSAWHQLGELFK